MFQKTVFDSGIRILTEAVPSRTVSVGIWVDVGARDEEADQNGISHFVEHMLFKGTASRSARDIAQEFDTLGGMSNAFTSGEMTAYFATVLDDQLERLVKLLADMFFHSLFEEEEVLREREVILQEISMVEDTPDDRIHELFAGLLWEEQALGQTVLGSREVVSGIRAKALCTYLERRYIPERIVIAAAGNVRHQDFCRLWEKQLVTGHRQVGSNWQRQAPVKRLPLRRVYAKDLEQVHMVLGTYGLATTDQDRYALYLLHVILGGNMSSRLFQEIREKKGLAYSVYSYLSSFNDTGSLAIYLGVDQGMVNRSLALVAKEITALRRGALSGAELANARDYAKAGIFLAAENMEARMSRIAKNELSFGRFVSFDEISEGFNQVGRPQVLALADRLLSTPLFAALLGPVEEAEIDWRSLDLSGH